jgi:acetoacetate decarboxylase
MDRNDVVRPVITAVNAAAYTPGPYRFTNREYLRITYRTDPTALRRAVPEPLKVREPMVRYEVMRMPDATGVAT